MLRELQTSIRVILPISLLHTVLFSPWPILITIAKPLPPQQMIEFVEGAVLVGFLLRDIMDIMTLQSKVKTTINLQCIISVQINIHINSSVELLDPTKKTSTTSK
jgi:hypothetical protein